MTKKIDPKRLELLMYHTGARYADDESVVDGIENGFRMVRGCVSLKDDDGEYLHYRGRTISVDHDSRAFRYNIGGYRKHWGCETLREMKAEIDRRIEEKEALEIAASRDIDQEIRSALIDNARLFGIQHRRDGVTLSAEIDGTTYLANTGSGCAEIEEIEQALAGHCTTSLMDPGDWRFIVSL